MFTTKYKIYSGEDFKKVFNNTRLIKFTNEENLKFHYSYQEGLNEDIEEFNPYKLCVAGGLHFCSYDFIEKWIDIDHGQGSNYYYWDVDIPDDAIVVETDNKFKANKIILTNRRRIQDDEDLTLKFLSLNCEFFNKIDMPSIQSLEKIFTVMFKELNNNYDLLPYFNKNFLNFEQKIRMFYPNSDIYQGLFSKFVYINPHIITYFKNPESHLYYSEEFIENMKKKAVLMNLQLFKEFDNFDRNSIEEFVDNCPFIVGLFKERDTEMFNKAILLEPDVYRLIVDLCNDKTHELAVDVKTKNIKYVPTNFITIEMTLSVLNENPRFVQFIPKSIQIEIFDDIKNYVKKDNDLFRLLRHYDKEICDYIINIDSKYQTVIPNEYIHLMFSDDSENNIQIKTNQEISFDNIMTDLDTLDEYNKNNIDNQDDEEDNYEDDYESYNQEQDEENNITEDNNNDSESNHESESNHDSEDEQIIENNQIQEKEQNDNSYYNYESGTLSNKPSDYSKNWFSSWF